MTSMLARPAGRVTTWRLGGRARKTVLVLHILAAGTWFRTGCRDGGAGLHRDLHRVGRSACSHLQSLRLVTVWPMFSAAMLSL